MRHESSAAPRAEAFLRALCSSRVTSGLHDIIVNLFSPIVFAHRLLSTQDVIDACLFEPGEWLPPDKSASVPEVPLVDRSGLATPCGLLVNELVNAPTSTLKPIESLLELAQASNKRGRVNAPRIATL